MTMMLEGMLLHSGEANCKGFNAGMFIDLALPETLMSFVWFQNGDGFVLTITGR